MGISLGYELRRSAPIHPFIQLEVTLPTYQAHGYVFDPSSTRGPTRDSIYTPSFTLSLGI